MPGLSLIGKSWNMIEKGRVTNGRCLLLMGEFRLQFLEELASEKLLIGKPWTQGIGMGSFWGEERFGSKSRAFTFILTFSDNALG
jgi:hypothetical protein